MFQLRLILGGGREPSQQAGFSGSPWSGGPGGFAPGHNKKLGHTKSHCTCLKMHSKTENDHFPLNPLISSFEYLGAELGLLRRKGYR